MTSALTPCVWGRVTCYGQVDADGVSWHGCGEYDIPASDLIVLKESCVVCKICGSSNIELSPSTCRGGTTRTLLQPTTPNRKPGYQNKLSPRQARFLQNAVKIDRRPLVNGNRVKPRSTNRLYVSNRPARP